MCGAHVAVNWLINDGTHCLNGSWLPLARIAQKRVSSCSSQLGRTCAPKCALRLPDRSKGWLPRSDGPFPLALWRYSQQIHVARARAAVGCPGGSLPVTAAGALAATGCMPGPSAGLAVCHCVLPPADFLATRVSIAQFPSDPARSLQPLRKCIRHVASPTGADRPQRASEQPSTTTTTATTTTAAASAPWHNTQQHPSTSRWQRQRCHFSR